MNFKLSWGLLLIFCFVTRLWAQTTDLSGAFVAPTEKPFIYRPMDPAFWSNIENKLVKSDFAGSVVEGAKQTRRYGPTTADGSEGRLATAIGLSRMGISFGAMQILIELAQTRAGTAVGESALNELAKIALQYNYDRDTLDALMNSNEFGPLHPDIQSFVSMFRYLYDLRFGFSRWAENQKKQIKADSPWDFELRYWTAIGDIARDKVTKAEVTFKELASSPQTPIRLKQMVHLQLARLAFEQGHFEPAHELYRQIGDLQVREQGRLILETAWTQYYLKKYDTALGLLYALRAPYFYSSLTPERFILEILIYRDLCHYEAVDAAVQQFKIAFNDSFRAIRKRTPLREDPVLLNLALLNRDVQEKANLIDQIRREREVLARYNWRGLSFYKPLMDEYRRKDRGLRRELDLILEPRVRDIAEYLLDNEEQIQFLDYTSKLDALRIVHEGEDRDFKTEPISYLTFESIFWPIQNEFWWDEFKNYKVLISSRCHMAKTPLDEKRERDFQ